MPRPHPILRPVALAVAIATTGVAAVPTARAQSATQAQAIDIPALPAAQALQRFVEATRFQLIYAPEVVRGVTTKSVSGTLAPREALARMLEGTGVQIVDTGLGAATLRPTTAAPSPAGDAAAAQTVIVSGIRVGIEAAISVKKNSDNIVEAVSAEDIGKLPDSSIAESIARLPGLSAQRVEGNAQVISVRGLSPDFATSLLNGRELVSTGDNRSVEFDQYPSELVAGVNVYKTPDAGLVGQGLSGTLDMLTVRPLNFGQRVVSVNVRGQKNSLGAEGSAQATGYRASASYIDQFADRTIGVVLGYARQETPRHEQQSRFYDPWSARTATTGSAARPGLPIGTFATDGVIVLRRTGARERDAFLAAIEFRPNKSFTSVVDYYHTKAYQAGTTNTFEASLGNNNGGFTPGLQWSNVQVNDSQTLVGGTAANLYPLVRGRFDSRRDTIDALGWNSKLKLDGGTTLTADVSWSKAERAEVIMTSNMQLAPTGNNGTHLDTLNIQFRNDDFPVVNSKLDYSDASKLFLRPTIFGTGTGRLPQVVDELKGFKLVAQVPLGGLFSSLDTGFNYADRSKEKYQPEGPILLGSQGNTTIAPEYLYGSVSLGFAGLGSIPTWDVPGVVAKYMTFTAVDNTRSLIPKSWNVYEKTSTAFVKGNIDTEWGGVNVRGNVGLQAVRVEALSTANYWDNNAPAGANVKPRSVGNVRTDILPSMNLSFSLASDQIVRIAAARQMARPRVDQLRSGITFDVAAATGKPSASGGNPEVDPWIANAFDASYEKYFGNKGYVAVAAFYKDLKSYIYTQSRDGYDFTELLKGYVPPGTCTVNGLSNQPCPAPQSTGTFTAPYNGQGGKMSGLELSASVPLNLVSRSLNGFGVQASASFTNSSIEIRDPESASNVGSGPIPLPGLSKRVVSLTFYYEKDGFEARVSQRRRSDFIGEVASFDAARTLRYVVGENVTDLQFGYKFSEGHLKGLGLLLQVNNLTDSPYQTYAGTKDRPLEYSRFGRTYLVGANYKF